MKHITAKPNILTYYKYLFSPFLAYFILCTILNIIRFSFWREGVMLLQKGNVLTRFLNWNKRKLIKKLSNQIDWKLMLFFLVLFWHKIASNSYIRLEHFKLAFKMSRLELQKVVNVFSISRFVESHWVMAAAERT